MAARVHLERTIPLIVAALGAFAAVAQVVLAPSSRTVRMPLLAFSRADLVAAVVGAASGLVLAVAAVWLIRRLPHNPTGRWLALAAGTYGLWLLGWQWASPIAPWAGQLAPVVLEASVVMALLGWPTGRLEPSWRDPVQRAVATFVVVGCLLPFIGYRFPVWSDTDWVLPTIGNLGVGVMVTTLTALLLGGVAPGLLLAAVVRRHRGLPSSMRSAGRPVFAGVVVLVFSEWLVVLIDVVVRPVLGSDSIAPPNSVTAWRVVVDVARFGIIGLTLAVAESRRRRLVGQAGGEVVITDRREWGADAELRRIIDDPTARLIIEGRGAPIPGGHAVALVDNAGGRLGWIEHDPDTVVTRARLDAAVAAVSLELVRERRRQEAETRTREVRAVQQRVLEAQDLARRRLERDLHDGVQQRLVALTLQASMLARRERNGMVHPADREELRNQIIAAIGLVDEVVQLGCPGVLEPGLAAGLGALDATVPLRTTLEVSGDVPREHPAAPALWFVASEALANSLKHSQATQILLRLEVAGGVAALAVHDNGIGGVTVPPGAIVRRLELVPASLEVTSPPGVGTAIEVRIELDRMAESTS